MRPRCGIGMRAVARSDSRSVLATNGGLRWNDVQLLERLFVESVIPHEDLSHEFVKEVDRHSDRQRRRAIH